MAVDFSDTLAPKSKVDIMVIGVGGAGGNAVNAMIQAWPNSDVKCVAANTDAQALTSSLCAPENRMNIGMQSTRGLGAGSHPWRGRRAAIESRKQIDAKIKGVDMLFITGGMGGGTGTGGGPEIAAIARRRVMRIRKHGRHCNMLIIGVVTKPFDCEGARKMRIAEAGIEEMSKYVDTLLVIPNQNLFRKSSSDTTFLEALKMSDNILKDAVAGISTLITQPGLINLDYADLCTIMSKNYAEFDEEDYVDHSNSGDVPIDEDFKNQDDDCDENVELEDTQMQHMGHKAMIGIGYGTGEKRAVMAAEAAISNPLLDNGSMRNAQRVLINITGAEDLTLHQVDEIVNCIRSEANKDAHVIFGVSYDEIYKEKIAVTIVATGLGEEEANDMYQQASLRAPAENQEASRQSIYRTVGSRVGESNLEGLSIARKMETGRPMDSIRPVDTVRAADPVRADPNRRPDYGYRSDDRERRGAYQLSDNIRPSSASGVFRSGNMQADPHEGPSVHNHRNSKEEVFEDALVGRREGVVKAEVIKKVGSQRTEFRLEDMFEMPAFMRRASNKPKGNDE